ncbi:MAG: molybdenum cofactor guanylyltransferase [bacterium]|nr:molybdenum cofactor guanylyltransferase [bacterium]
MANRKGIAAVVLAGGLSTRWGRDKALVRWGERRLIDHVTDSLPAERSETVFVVRPEQAYLDWPTGRVVYDDPTLPAGPLRGLIRGLEACQADLAWVVACDQPLLNTDLLRHLAEVDTTDTLAVIPHWDGRPQPLVGLYRQAAAAELAARLAAGERSLIDALKSLDTRPVDEAECRRHDPEGESFLNLNRPDQLAALTERLGGPPREKP